MSFSFLKKIIILCLVLTLSFIVAVFILVPPKNKEFRYNSKFWIHRGGTPENKITSLKKSYETGYRGFEVDIFVQKEKIYLSHDAKESFNDTDTLGMLSPWIDDKSVNLWLDLKNINLFNISSLDKSLKSNFSKNFIREQLILESKNPLRLIFLNYLGYNVILWTESSHQNLLAKIKYYIWFSIADFFNFQGVSFNNSKYNLEEIDFNTSLNKHIFTVKEIEELKVLDAYKSLKVILTPLNYDLIPNQAK